MAPYRSYNSNGKRKRKGPEISDDDMFALRRYEILKGEKAPPFMYAQKQSDAITRPVLDEKGIQAYFRPPYLNFGRRIFKLVSELEEEDLTRSIETEISKWEKRRLDREVLNAIVKAHHEQAKAEK